VAHAAVKGGKTLAKLAAFFNVRPNQITDWNAQRLDGAGSVLKRRNLFNVLTRKRSISVMDFARRSPRAGTTSAMQRADSPPSRFVGELGAGGR
jgi:hypothetical protein